MLVEYWGLFRFPIGARWVELLPFEGRACLYGSPELLDRTHPVHGSLGGPCTAYQAYFGSGEKKYFYELTHAPK